MLTTTITKAALPNLAWSGSEPGLLAIVTEALRKDWRKPTSPSAAQRFAKPRPVPFTWL